MSDHGHDEIDEARARLDALEARLEQLEARLAGSGASPSQPHFYDTGTIHPELDDPTIAP